MAELVAEEATVCVSREEEEEGDVAASVEACVRRSAAVQAEPRTSSEEEAEPYRQQYAARRILEEGLAELEEGRPLLRARLEVRLGAIGNDVEEPHTAEKWLKRAMSVLAPTCWEAAAREQEGFDATKLAALAHLEQDTLLSLNHAAVLWTGRGEQRRALRLLQVAEACYLGGGAGRDIDDLHTHTLFYLAQVHASLGDAAASSAYCRETLQRQLLDDLVRPEYDAHEWGRNALGLASYYAKTGAFRSAASSIRAAMRVAQSLKPQEKTAELVADVWRAWGDLHARALAGEQPSDDDEPAFTGDEPTKQQLKEHPLREEIVDLASALPIFREARFAFERAAEYYLLDGWVTDFVALMRGVSGLYKDLADHFETDHRRRQAMRERRRELLEPLCEILNAKVYADLKAVLYFELGELNSELLTAKERNQQEWKPAALRKCMIFRDRAIAAYDSFVGICSDDGVSFTAGAKTPEEAGPFLRALFYAARLAGRDFTPPGADRQSNALAAFAESLRRFRQCQQAANDCSFDDHLDFFKREREICAEMIELLPHRITLTKDADPSSFLSTNAPPDNL